MHKQTLSRSPVASACFVSEHLWRARSAKERMRRFADHRDPFWFDAKYGLKFKLYPGGNQDQAIFLNGLHEHRALILMALLSGRARRAVDIGANIGNHALFMTRFFDRVEAFEPNPAVLKRLRENAAANAADNLTVHPVGASDRNGSLPFLFSGENGVNASRTKIVADTDQSDAALQVRTGDEILGAYNDIDVIKIDVEGHELEALRGLADAIRRNQPVVFFESDILNEDQYEKRAEILTIFNGYELYECDLSLKRNLTFFLAKGFVFSGAPALRPLGHTRSFHHNLVAIPNEERRRPVEDLVRP